MSVSKKLRESYVMADDLFEWQAEQFKSFEAYKKWMADNGATVDLLEEERMYRVIQAALSGLVRSSATGSAAATAQLKSLTGLSRPVGRPSGSTNQTDEHRMNIMLRETQDYQHDVNRLTVSEELI
jgi:hypothetical protein